MFPKNTRAAASRETAGQLGQTGVLNAEDLHLGGHVGHVGLVVQSVSVEET